MILDETSKLSPEEHLKALAEANIEYWNLSSRLQSQWRSGRDPGQEAEDELDTLRSRMRQLTEAALKS